MSPTNTGPHGPFRYTISSGTWWWSEPVYRIHGFAPGEVVPTTELILFHEHPEDADSLEQAMRSVLSEGAAFSLWHRIVDATRRVRQVLSVGDCLRDPQGDPAEVRGYMVDLTDAERRAFTGAVDEAVRASARSRADIEQAKGILMLTYSVGSARAFSLLRTVSQHTNTKVRDLAASIVRGVEDDGSVPCDVRDRCDRLLAATRPAEPEPAT